MSRDAPRLPPGQGLIRTAENWPVVGESAPRSGDNRPWSVRIEGAVARPRSWTLEELAARARETRRVDFHCVTRWSKFDMEFTGLSLLSLIEAAEPAPEAWHVRLVARSDRDHDTGLSLADARRLEPLVALTCDGAPLAAEHGGPVRVITPGKYGYKSLKWLERVELLAEPALGWWERGAGYHDNADPWAEERYVGGNIPPELRARMIAMKRIGGRSLLSVDFSGEALDSLDAREAELRHCRFDRAGLSAADFTGANLSNASLRGADLRRACFLNSDLEGADFSGADLRQADFTGASVFGASFCDADGGSSARLTRDQLTPEQIGRLVDAQAAHLFAKFAQDAIDGA